MLSPRPAFLFATLLLAGPAAASGVTVDIRLAQPDALEVRYALPPGCDRLPFLKDGSGAARIRAQWQPLADCAAADGDALGRDGSACATPAFRVPVSTDKVTGYPAAFPMGDAVYVHLSNYAVGAQCGPVSYRLSAPAGVAANSRVYAAGDVPSLQDDDASALLLSKPLAAQPGHVDYFDPALGPDAVARIREVADGTIARLARALPHARFERPILAAALAHEPGGPNIGGDAGDVLRLTLFNWPQVPGRDEQRQMVKLVSHEFAHRFQLRDAVSTYPDARLIHEGGGEFLRWMVSLQAGWLSPAEAAEDLDNALSTCLLAVGHRGWREIPPREIASQRLEYACGLPAYVYALAARQGGGEAFSRVDDFYAALRGGARPEFARALECGPDAPGCTPRWLPALLGDMPMDDAWAGLFNATRMAKPRPPNQSERDAMTTLAVQALLEDDCGGSSFTPTDDSLLVDAMPTCRTVHADSEIVRAETRPLFGDPGTLDAMNAACAAHGAVRFGLRSGASLTLPCAHPYLPRAVFYRADMDQLVRSLNAGLRPAPDPSAAGAPE